MKVLSIIGIVISLVGIMAGLYVISEAHCYCAGSYDSYYGYNSGSYTDDDAVIGGLMSLIVGVFFLIFSIVATVVSFKRKTPAVPFQPPFQPPFQQPNYQQPPFPPQQPNYQQPPYPPQQPPFNQGGNSNIQP